MPQKRGGCRLCRRFVMVKGYFEKNYSSMWVSNEILKNIVVKSMLNLNMKIKTIAYDIL